jgi:ubiquinone/menaquinone biosynthesis C-methylase UbiE
MSQENSRWNQSAGWYDDMLASKDSYQRTVILPNLLRILKITTQDVILDVGCGTGFFTFEIIKTGAKVIGIDIAEKMIVLAEKRKLKLPMEERKSVRFYVACSEKMKGIRDGSVSKAILILSLQNMKDVSGTMAECKRVLKRDGEIFIVMNHPSFRVPGNSSWGWDEKPKKQFRRVDAYMSEYAKQIEMHPGERQGEYTLSYHRPLQWYMKIFAKGGFCVTHLEEWISPKKSQSGPRADAEDISRKEIPLFLFLHLLPHFAFSKTTRKSIFPRTDKRDTKR